MKNFLKKLTKNEKFIKSLKVLGYIGASAIVTLTVRYLKIVEMDAQTILLMNGFFNFLIYQGKQTLSELMVDKKK